MAKQTKASKRIRVQPMRKRTQRSTSEVTRLGSVLRSLGGLGGSALGGLIGMPASGGAVGRGLGASISKWLGSGDYQVGQNSIVSGTLRASTAIPDMHKNDQSIVVRHKEFITTINSSTSFQVQGSFDLNPGNPLLFPWLTGVAVRFQEYKIRGMVFHYVPTSGSAVSSSNAALGSVMLQTSYRASDSAPGSKAEMMNEYCSSETVPCDTVAHPIECDPKENPFNIQYIRSNNTATNEDKLLYDLGTTHVAVQGCQTNGNPIGDLWVTYEIELKKPIVSSNITTPFRTYGLFATGPPDSGHLLDGTQVSQGALSVTASANTLTFLRGTVGTFQIMVRLTGPFNPFAWGGSPTLVNCSAMTGPGGSTTLTTSKLGGVDTLLGPVYVTFVQILDPSVTASVTIPVPSALTGTIVSSHTTVSIYSPLL